MVYIKLNYATSGNSEKYRKCYYCPIEGWRSKSVKKKSNNLISVHKIVDIEEHKKVLVQAKQLGVAKQGQQRQKLVNLSL